MKWAREFSQFKTKIELICSRRNNSHFQRNCLSTYTQTHTHIRVHFDMLVKIEFKIDKFEKKNKVKNMWPKNRIDPN